MEAALVANDIMKLGSQQPALYLTNGVVGVTGTVSGRSAAAGDWAHAAYTLDGTASRST
jgi:hypothetical protein